MHQFELLGTGYGRLAFLPLGIVLFFCAITIGETCNLIVFICVSLIINKDKHLFICILAVCVLPNPGVACLYPLPIFSGVLVFLVTYLRFINVVYKRYSYIVLGWMLQACPNQLLSLLNVFCSIFGYITAFIF